VELWLRELRAPFFTATIIPVFLGATVAFEDSGNLDIPLLLLTLFATLCLHAGANMANDYFDYISGCDTHPQYQDFSAPFFGGSRLLPEGLLEPGDVHRAAILSIGIGTAAGLYIVWRTGWPILLLGLVGVFTGYLYVTCLAPRGLGEVAVFFSFGPLTVIGSQLVQSGVISPGGIYASLPVGVFITAVLWINEVPDLDADRAAGKTTLVVRLGRSNAVKMFIALLVAGYASIVVLSLAGIIPACSLISMVTVPLALRAAVVAWKHRQNPSMMIPANAGTILVHALTGILLILSYPLCGFLFPP